MVSMTSTKKGSRYVTRRCAPRPESILMATGEERRDDGEHVHEVFMNDEASRVKPEGPLEADREHCRTTSRIYRGEELRVGTWNVRTMNEKGKLENVKREMERLKLNVMGLCEVRWKGEGDFMSNGVRVIYSGGERHENGVAVMLDKETATRVVHIDRCSDRMMVVKIQAVPVDMIVVQVYMPTSAHDEEEIDDMYGSIEEVISKQKGTDHVVLMGDWNAVVGQGREGKLVGNFGLGKRNESGQKLVELCKRNKMMVTNTWFQQRKRRIYTWKKPGDTGRYQIDYILVRQRYRNSVKGSWSCPGADANTDHNLVTMKTQLRLKKIKKAEVQRKWNIERLRMKGREYREQVESEVSSGEGKSVEERWRAFKCTINKCAESVIGYRKRSVTKKPWVTEEMLQKMDKRREWKSVNTDKGRERYKQLHKELRIETQKAREAWWEEQCEELETMNRMGRSDLMYARVKTLTKKKKNGSSECAVKNEDGILLTDRDEVRDRWKEYIEKLYDGAGKPSEEQMSIENETEVPEDDKGPELLEQEIVSAIKQLKKGKSPGVDGIPGELLRECGEKATKELVELSKQIYREGRWPEDFTQIMLIPLKKKPNAVECEDHRTISLISHAAKIMLKVLTRRIEVKAKEYISRNQFGFRQGLGTRDAVGVMKMLCERSLDFGNEVYICFVDFEKAFDRVNWVKMMDVLKAIGVEWRDRRLLRELYMREEAVVRTGGKNSKPCSIGRGVRQGCPLSPLLFAVYVESMMMETYWESEEGIKVGGMLLRDIRFADDKGMVAGSETELQSIMDKLSGKAAEYDMKINANKTKVMVVSREADLRTNIVVDGQPVEQVKQFKYLGSWLTEDGRNLVDIKTRIGMAKSAFAERKELLTSRLSLALKKKIVETVIWPVLLYGCETWTLRKDEIKRIEACEMWVWRRLMKIKWSCSPRYLPCEKLSPIGLGCIDFGE